MKNLPILNVQFFRDRRACYDPAKVLGEDWSGTILDLLNMENIPAFDKMWAFSQIGATSLSIQRLAAVNLVRLTPLGDGRTVFNLLTDQRSIDALIVAERYAKGKATKEKLKIAAAAADAAYADATDAAAYAVAAAAYAATDAAYADADAAAVAAVAVDAAYAVAAATTKKAQVQIIIDTIIKEL